MTFFQQKRDFKKDILRLEFNLDTKQYTYYYGNQEVSYNMLSRRTQKKLAEKNKALIDNPELLEQQINIAKQVRRIDYLRKQGYSSYGFEYLGPVLGTMSAEMEKYLNDLTSKEDVLLGIHRLSDHVTAQDIKDILTNGISITGHTGSGANSHTVELSSNVGYYPDNKIIIKELMYANEYKNSPGSILIEIPYTDLNTASLYITDEEGLPKLNSKYILGYVPVDETHHISQLITADQFNKSTSTVNIEPSNFYFNLETNSIDENENRFGKSK